MFCLSFVLTRSKKNNKQSKFSCTAPQILITPTYSRWRTKRGTKMNCRSSNSYTYFATTIFSPEVRKVSNLWHVQNHISFDIMSTYDLAVDHVFHKTPGRFMTLSTRDAKALHAFIQLIIQNYSDSRLVDDSLYGSTGCLCVVRVV